MDLYLVLRTRYGFLRYIIGCSVNNGGRLGLARFHYYGSNYGMHWYCTLV